MDEQEREYNETINSIKHYWQDLNTLRRLRRDVKTHKGIIERLDLESMTMHLREVMKHSHQLQLEIEDTFGLIGEPLEFEFSILLDCIYAYSPAVGHRPEYLDTESFFMKELSLTILEKIAESDQNARDFVKEDVAYLRELKKANQ